MFRFFDALSIYAYVTALVTFVTAGIFWVDGIKELNAIVIMTTLVVINLVTFLSLGGIFLCVEFPWSNPRNIFSICIFAALMLFLSMIIWFSDHWPVHLRRYRARRLSATWRIAPERAAQLVDLWADDFARMVHELDHARSDYLRLEGKSVAWPEYFQQVVNKLCDPKNRYLA